MEMIDEPPPAEPAAAPGAASSYVIYGRLQKNHQFVDWIRVFLSGEDEARPQKNDGADTTNANTGGGGGSDGVSKEMDDRAFELYREHLQECVSGDDNAPPTDGDGNQNDLLNNNNNTTINLSSTNKPASLRLKKLLVNTKNLSRDTVSYGVFAADWNPLHISPRHSNLDTAILIHAASEEGKKAEEGSVGLTESKRTWLSKEDLAEDTLVPARRSAQHQFLIKQSVNLMFRQQSVQFFACFPLRYSPRTIYRFDMGVGDGNNIKIKFWNHKKNGEAGSGDDAEKKIPVKLNQMRLSMAEKTASYRNTLASKVETTKQSFLNHKNKNKDSGNGNPEENNKDTADAGAGADGDAGADASTEKPMNAKLSQMRQRMSTNTAGLREGFASTVSNTKQSILNMKNKNSNSEINTSDDGEAKAETETEKMGSKLSQMRLRMATNTAEMRNNLATKVSTTKESIAKMVTTPTSAEAKSDEKTIPSTLSAEFTIDDTEEDQYVSIVPKDPSATEGESSLPPPPSPAGYVALTIDDAPCRFDDGSHSKMQSVLDLLKRYNAKATFMVVSSFLTPAHESDMIRLLKEGHELANHGVRDEPMDKTAATSLDAFVEALDECNGKIEDLQKKAETDVGVKWFRAPHCKYTKTMEEGLVLRDMHNVMCDAYAACPIVEDAPWIASALGKQIRNGSIAILHMPEKLGFREYIFEALEHLLEDLCVRRGFRVVTVGELQKISEEAAASKAASAAKPAAEDTELI